MAAKMRFGVRLLGAVGVAVTGIRIDHCQNPGDNEFSLPLMSPYLHGDCPMPFHAPALPHRWRSQDPRVSQAMAKRAEATIRCIRMVSRTMVEQGIPGACLSVSINGRSLVNVGMGISDLENDVGCTRNTVMRIASISKPLTAVALLQLWEKKQVDLDAAIQRYVPSFPKKSFRGEPVQITTRQLLSHMGGIRHYKTSSSEDEKEEEKTGKKMDKMKEYFITEHYHSVQEALKLFANDELVAKPGISN